MKMRRIAFVILLGLALVWAIRTLLPNEESRLRKTWATLLTLSETGSQPTLLAGARRALEIQSYFATGSVLEVGAPYPMTITRGQLPGVLNQAWNLTEQLRVRSLGVELQLANDRKSAVMETTLELSAVVRGETMSSLEPYQVNWIKYDGDWKIATVRPVVTIRNPAARQ